MTTAAELLELARRLEMDIEDSRDSAPGYTIVEERWQRTANALRDYASLVGRSAIAYTWQHEIDMLRELPADYGHTQITVQPTSDGNCCVPLFTASSAPSPEAQAPLPRSSA